MAPWNIELPPSLLLSQLHLSSAELALKVGRRNRVSTSLKTFWREGVSIDLGAGSKTKAGIGGIEDGVVVLDEFLADNGVDTRAATVVDPGVVLARGEAVEAVLGGRDQVLRGGKVEGGRTKLNTEVLGRLCGEHCKARAAIGLAASSGEEFIIGRGRDVDERSAGVDNTSGRGCKSGRAVSEGGDRDTPIRRSSTALEGREVSDRSSIFGAVGATEGQLAVGVIRVAAGFRLEVNTEDLGRNRALLIEVVHKGRDGVGIGDGAFGEIDWAKADNAIDATEAGC